VIFLFLILIAVVLLGVAAGEFFGGGDGS